MIAGGLAETDATYQEDGITATRSAAGYFIVLPRAVSANRQLSIIAALWDVWIAARSDVCGIDLNWTIDASKIDDLPLSLIAVLSAIDTNLAQAGRKLRVLGRTPPTPSSDVGLRRLQA